ncbi:MAG TPA: hydroxymyristoyl-ACP dehydratase [Gammaproteobacteria bacterium]|nr:hydroxymyristoyl-ACP dehydratase [Gammaproteobacteria bacterium]
MKGLPTVVAQHAGPEQAELELLVEEGCPWFEGHFPDQPILPGVVQIGWAAHFASELYGTDPSPTVLERVKFKRPILPGSTLVLHLQRSAHKIRYDYRQDAASLSSGVLCFGDAA